MKKIDRLAEPGSRIHIIVLFVFAVATYLLCDALYVALAEALAAVVLLVLNMTVSAKKRRELMQYIESVTYEAESAKNNAMLNFPLPMVTYLLDSGRIIWGNQAFFSICGKKEPSFDARMADMVPGYDGKWLLEGRSRCSSLVEVGERRYQVSGSRIRGQNEENVNDIMGITYWVDVTDYDDIKREYAASRPVVILILLDNYDELVKSVSERAAGELRNMIEDRLSQWVEGSRGFLRRYDREHYMFLCERRYYDRLAEEKFTVIDKVHDVVNISGIHATISLGVGMEGVSIEENFSFASMSVEMALSRGGDQAVVKNRVNFSFYGGRDAEIETRTKVKSRVVANALRSYIKDATVTYVMGHAYADMDTLGAAVGICCIARKYGKKARIVIGDEPNACGEMIALLKKQREYEDIFITPREAMLQVNSRSLLVIVDTSRPEQVEDPALLQTVSRLALIDHHRRGATFIDNAALTFYEPYASSVCELMTELLQELVEQSDICRFEAEALLAGIVTDTKSFTMRTGERTFDAAAFLRRTGADMSTVKRLLQNDFQSTIEKFSVMEKATVYKNDICLASADHPVDRVVAAQAADEMLNISGIEASVVVYPTEEGAVGFSARSIGTLNVQVLMEALGGGGNKSAAAARIEDMTVEEANARLKTAIDDYLA